MAKQRKAASKKAVPAKSAGRKSNKTSNKSILFASTETFEVLEGVPRTYNRPSQEEETKILNTLAKLKTGKNHAAIPSKYRSAVKRIATQNFPAYKMKTSYNKHKHIINVWWEK